MKYLVLILITILFLSACKAPNNSASSSQASSQSNTSTSTTPSVTSLEGLKIRTELSGDPALGAAQLNVYVLNDGNGVTGAEVKVTGDMTHAGMVPVLADATEVEQGLYASEGFEFTMAGDWIVTTEVKLPSGEKAMDDLKLTIPSQ